MLEAGLGAVPELPPPPGPATEGPPAGEKHAGPRVRAFFFRLGGREYAVGSEWCGEIFALKGLTRVPLAPPSLTGVVALRGGLVPVLDLGRLVGLGQGSAAPVKMAVCVRDQRFTAAFGFDESLGFEPLASLPRESSSEGSAATLGEVTRDGTSKASLLNVPALFDRVTHELRRSSLASGLAIGKDIKESERTRARGGA